MKKKYYKLIIIVLMVGSLGLVGFKAADNYFEISKNLEIYTALIKEIKSAISEKDDTNKKEEKKVSNSDV